jgi:hypothetical protein
MNYLADGFSLEIPTLFVRRALSDEASLILPFAKYGIPEEDRTVLLAPRFSRVPFVLANGRSESSQAIPAAERGFMSREEIARLMARLPNAGDQITNNVVTEYVYKARKAIDEVIYRLPEDLLPAFDLFDSKRGLGYRIGSFGLRVVALD